jgi:hypothetical protein
MRYVVALLICLFIIPSVSKAETVPEAWFAWIAWVKDMRPQRDAGTMKRSVYWKSGFDFMINTNMGPYKSDCLTLLDTMIKTSNAVEAGKISEETYDNIRRKIMIQGDEIQNATRRYLQGQARELETQKQARWRGFWKGVSDWYQNNLDRQLGVGKYWTPPPRAIFCNDMGGGTVICD